MKEFMNQATATGRVDETPIQAVSNNWTVVMKQKKKCLCNHICECIRIYNLNCVEACCVRQTGICCSAVSGRHVLRVDYEILVCYQTIFGESKTQCLEGCTSFFELPDDLNPANAVVTFSDPSWLDVCCCNVEIEFSAMLCESPCDD